VGILVLQEVALASTMKAQTNLEVLLVELYDTPRSILLDPEIPMEVLSKEQHNCIHHVRLVITPQIIHNKAN
jgi:hypothetical protein